jgi:ATP-dependent Clp protease protease subunit
MTTRPNDPFVNQSAGAPAQGTTPVAKAGTNLLSWGDSLFERLLAQRIIVLGQEVNDEIANKLCAQMLLLAAEDPEADISLYVNSPGGSITAGMAIFDTMNFISCDVATYAIGMAASMGQFLLSAGTSGKRYALPNAEILMHQPSSGIGGTESDITIQADRLRRMKERLSELIASHTGQTVERIVTDSERDRWFTAEEAREYGLLDQVITRASQVPSSNGSSAS